MNIRTWIFFTTALTLSAPTLAESTEDYFRPAFYVTLSFGGAAAAQNFRAGARLDYSDRIQSRFERNTVDDLPGQMRTPDRSALGSNLPALLQWEFNPNGQLLTVHGLPVAEFNSRLSQNDSEDEYRTPPARTNVGGIIAASGLAVALVVAVVGEAFEDSFEDWEGPEFNFGDGGGGSGGGSSDDPCPNGVQVGDQCVGG